MSKLFLWVTGKRRNDSSREPWLNIKKPHALKAFYFVILQYMRKTASTWKNILFYNVLFVSS